MILLEVIILSFYRVEFKCVEMHDNNVVEYIQAVDRDRVNNWACNHVLDYVMGITDNEKDIGRIDIDGLHFNFEIEEVDYSEYAQAGRNRCAEYHRLLIYNNDCSLCEQAGSCKYR